jgi:hypothetical protein
LNTLLNLNLAMSWLPDDGATAGCRSPPSPSRQPLQPGALPLRRPTKTSATR